MLNYIYIGTRLAAVAAAIVGLLVLTTIRPTPHWFVVAWMVIEPGLGALALVLYFVRKITNA